MSSEANSEVRALDESALQIERHLDPHANEREALVRDVQAGLGARPLSLPPKYFYDARGAELFDAICDTPEYYQTRTEDRLLARIGDALMARLRPQMLVELGSGAARKTPRLLGPMLTHAEGEVLFVPVDVAEQMLRESAGALLAQFPEGLRVHGMVADFVHHLDHLPGEDAGAHHTPRLFAFLGGTIGNFTDEDGAAFLAQIERLMGPGDALLVGVDLVKDTAVLHAAYNDAAGITAEFNRNALRVLNRRLDGNFPVDEFAHIAFYDEEKERIEMHLEATRAMEVSIPGADLALHLDEGERIHTEISRKFTRDSIGRMLVAGGLRLDELFTSADEYFGIALAVRQ